MGEHASALKCLSVSETVKELDRRGARALVFPHAGHGRVNLVYRRADGHIGWIDLPTIEKNDH
jgi:alpha-beta hydrolase superfamily lysophospholipase